MAAPPLPEYSTTADPPMAQAEPVNAQAVEMPPAATAVPVNAASAPVARVVAETTKPNKCLHIMLMVRTARGTVGACVSVPWVAPAVLTDWVGARARVLALKLYACLAQVCGITNIVIGLLSLIPRDGLVNWPGAILCLAIGIPATVASSMYNPCGCCPCDNSDSGTRGASSSRVKTIAILCIVAAVAALAGTVTTAAFMAQVASWPLPKAYHCCPPDNKELTTDSCYSEEHGGVKEAVSTCSSPVVGAKNKFDCIAGGPYPPFFTEEEPLTCFKGRVAVERELPKKDENGFRGIQNFVMILLGIGLAVYALSLLATVPAAYFTWMEAKQAQRMEFGGPA